MLNITRRGLSSVARPLFHPSTYSRCKRPAHTQDLLLCLSRIKVPGTVQSPSSASGWRRSIATSAAAEDHATEGEIEQEVHSQTPPSDNRINRAVKNGPVTKFAELAERGMVCQTLVKTITETMGLETMTPVQSLTIEKSLQGQDILAQARTGTGKTLAFLIPLLQNIINVDPQLEKLSGVGRKGESTDIRAIIISPTRELAEQIAVEANKLTRATGVIVQTAVGGSRKALGLQTILRQGCHVLVGTPGRLNDILSDPYSKVRAPNLSCFVLDEADRLLDQGFAPDIASIQDTLPKRSDVDRQTLLYSATVPREVMQVVRRTMKPDFQFVRTVQEGEQQTHEKVPQKIVTATGFENLMPALLELCKRGMNTSAGATGGPARQFKAIVYFSSTADVALAAAVLQNLRKPGSSVFHPGPLSPAKIIEIHARLDQNQRTRAADSFRRAESAILLSSDVTARGMDFPNVTHVIQIGLPPSEEQYVHRIGRTARANQGGEGWMIISQLEARECRRRLPNMPLQVDNTLETARVNMKKDAQLPEQTANILTQVGDAMKLTQRRFKVASYMASLGMYSWVPNKQELIGAMNDRAQYGWGLETPPLIGFGLATKLNIARVPGVHIGQESPTPHYADNTSRMRQPRGMGYQDSRSRGEYGSAGYGGDRGGGRGGGRGGEFRRAGDYGGDRGGSYGGNRGEDYGEDRGGSYRGNRGGNRSHYDRRDRGSTRY